MKSFSKRIILAAVFMALISPCYSTVQAKEAPKAVVQPGPGDVVVRVNGKNITREHLETATNNLLPMLTYHSSVNPERLKEIQEKALNNLINNVLIYQYAKDKGLDKVEKKEIDKELSEIKKRLPKGESLDKVLKRSKMTIDDLRDDIKKDIVVMRISKSRGEELRKKAAETVNESFMKDYYQKNTGKFKEPEQIHLRSILIKADPSGGQRVWNEALKKAEEISKLAKGGKDFAKLAEERSEDPNAKKGGDMGWAHKGSLFPEIEEAVANMKTGEITEPIMTIYGYHIVKVEGKKASVQKKFEELNKEKLEKELEDKEYKRLWDGWIKDMRNAAKIEYLQKLS